VTISAPTRRPPAQVQPEPDNDPDAKGTLHPWTVLAIFAVLLGVLVSVSAGFGNDPVVLAISGSSAGLVLLLAAAVWLDHRFRPRRTVFGLPVRIGGAFLFAVAAAAGWMSLAFGEFMAMIAVVPLIGAIGLQIAAWRHRG
jgi:hypothetical protein